MSQVTVDAIYREIMELKEEIAEIKFRVNEDYELSEWAKERIREYEGGDQETVVHGKLKEKFA